MEDETNKVRADVLSSLSMLMYIQTLHKKHKIDIPEPVKVQEEAADIPLLFSDLCNVSFNKGGQSTIV